MAKKAKNYHKTGEILEEVGGKGGVERPPGDPVYPG